MNTPMVWATTDPTALAVWDDVQAKAAERAEKLRTWIAEHKHDIWTRGGFGDAVAHGIQPQTADAPPVPGFVKYQSYDYLRPDSRSGAGREAKELLKTLSPYPVRRALEKRAGIPHVRSGPGFFRFAAVRVLHDPPTERTLFVSFSGPIDDWQPDETWRSVPLSEWYALLEARDEVSA